MDVDTKVCRTCGIEKPQDDFYANPRRRDGFVSACKSCVKEAAKRNRHLTREWARWKKYGVTRADFENQLAKQDQLCGVCLRPLGKDMVVDHCHKTNVFRGILHRRCNLVLGHAREDPILLERASYYALQCREIVLDRAPDAALDFEYG